MPAFPSEANSHRPLSIRTSNSNTESMASQRSGYVTGFGPDSHGPQQHLGLRTAQQDGAYRRRSMTIQDMLNPSDGEVKHSSQSQSARSSSEEERQSLRYHSRSPISSKGHKSPRSGIHSRRGSTSHGGKGGKIQPSHKPGRSPASSPELALKTRAFRHPYTTEEVHFIWYLRIDRGYLWPDLLDAFNDHFSRNGHKRVLGGLQCRYYRLLGQNSIPQVRMLRTADMVQRYGMRASLARNGLHPTYSWLGGQYQNNAYGEVLDNRPPPRRVTSTSDR